MWPDGSPIAATIHGINIYEHRCEIDTSRIGVWGFSQGGGLSLASAALDRRISTAVAGVPWLCNFPVLAELTTVPNVEPRNCLAQHPRAARPSHGHPGLFAGLGTRMGRRRGTPPTN